MTSSKSLKSFAACYAELHLACELAERMAGDGSPENLAEKDVHELKRLISSAACAAGGIHATHDGRQR